MNNDLIIVKNAVSLELCKFTAIEYEILEKIYKEMYPGYDPSDMCQHSFARYCPLPFETLSVYLQPLIEDKTRLTLYPSYSYARIYYKNSELVKHRDRASSEITVSVCIEKDLIDWPLFVEDSNGVSQEVNLNQGDLVIYSGRSQLHWREPFTGNKQIQAFLQYVDANGSSANLKWDTRPALGLPFEWTSEQIKQEMNDIRQR